MKWHPIEDLEPGRLVVLHFHNEVAPQCVGYVENDGICGWPEKASGRKPDGWTDLSSLFSGMTAEVRRAVGGAL